MTTEVVKIVLLGDSGAGKTSIINHFMTGKTSESLKPTVGAAFVTKNIVVEGHSLELRIWDTAGQVVYRGLAPMYYRSAQIAIIVFDVTNSPSYESVDYWVQELKKNLKGNTTIMICGNKSDLYEDRVIHDTTAKEFASANGALYCECSALSGVGVNSLFEVALSNMLKESKQATEIGEGVDLTKEKKEGGRAC